MKEKVQIKVADLKLVKTKMEWCFVALLVKRMHSFSCCIVNQCQILVKLFSSDSSSQGCSGRCGKSG